ncbi:ZZ-type zinc finger-containing protein 3 [Trichonephila clavata]|uniref:ZZ-type zinc finger-containing protein 3 n=1 Tax=Trichonephila clavata TaxID=2740835 RepID=A0A8X6GDB4_TRICU|nr:ZZ-type zinc finger-containing protein 3 [Trichonephila clavata]
MDGLNIKLEPPDYFESFDDIACGSFNVLNEETILDYNNILNETEIKTEIDTKIKSELETEIKAEVETEIKAEVETEIKAEVETEIKAEVETDIKTDSCENTQEMDYNSCGEFNFDSDHPALKNNSDYKELLKTIAVLEAQRSKAIKDLDRLHEVKNEALSDPIAFVERLQKGEKIKFPARQKIYPVPAIDWSKYALNGDTSLSRRQLTRLSSRATKDLFKKCKDKSGNQHDQKPPKINHYWTAEEQKHLEELLIKFPPEEIESRRWEKIANCLENRTPIQVASRVQKYFIKLLKAGMPIPGRMPNTTYLKKPRRNVIRQQPSTFMVSHTLPVYMPEADDEFSYSYHQPQNSDENSLESRAGVSDDDSKSELCGVPGYEELALLKNIQKEKIQNYGLNQHMGFKVKRLRT